MEQSRLLKDELKRLTTELQAYNAEQSAIWGDLDDRLLARYIAGECSQVEKRLVESAADQFPAIRETIEIVSGAFADVESESSVTDLSDEPHEPTSRATIAEQPQLYRDALKRVNPTNLRASAEKWKLNRWRAVAAAAFLATAFAAVAELRTISSQRDEIVRLTADRDEALKQLAKIQQNGDSAILQGTSNAAIPSIDWLTLITELDLKNRAPEESLSLLKKHAEKRVRDRIEQLQQRRPTLTAAELLSELFKEFSEQKPSQQGQK